MVTVYLYIIFIAIIGIERIVELRISNLNAKEAFKKGGVEFGQKHFGVMKVLHTAFLFACGIEVLLLNREFIPQLGYPMLALALLAQGLRYWAVSSLGGNWNVRVIIVPNQEVVKKGPYSFIRHPNYLAVVIEGAALPLIHGAWITAIGFTLLNALLLYVRINCEEKALTENSNYDRDFGKLRRFLPLKKEHKG